MTLRTVWKPFATEGPDALVAWLEAEARAGWHLERCDWLRWTFAQGDPREERFAVDFQNRMKWRQMAIDTPAFPERTWREEEKEYLAVAKASGWTFVDRSSTCYVFRATDSEALPFHSDPEARLEIQKHRLQQMVLPLACLAPQLILRLIQEVRRGWSTSLNADRIFTLVLLAILLPWGIHVARSYARYRTEKAKQA